MNRLKYLLALMLITVIGLGLGMAYGYTRHRPVNEESTSHSNTMIPNPLPESVDHLVRSSDLIVVGKVGEVVNTEIFYGYGPEAEELASQDKETSANLGLPVVDYEIVVEQVIMTNSNTEQNGTILLRIAGAPEPENRDSNFIEVGTRKLLFLTANPDGTYGISSFMHLMSIEAESVTYYFEGEKRTPFGLTGMSASDFINIVEDSVAGQAES